MEAERFGRIFAVFLIAVTGRVLGGSGGNITFFEVTPTIVTPGSTFTIKCTVDGTGSTTSPILHIKKSFANSAGNMSVVLSTNEEKQDDQIGALADRSNVDYQPNGVVVSVTFSIYSAKPEDTGNYTCATSNKTNKRTAFVSVLIDPVNATMLIDDKVVTGRVSVDLRRTYAVSCMVLSNPCPNMTFISDTTDLSDKITYIRKLERGSTTDLLSPVTCRSFGNITWTADVGFIGKPLKCSAVVEGRSIYLASFEPHINHTEPLFYCNDTVTLRSHETDLVINCSVYSQVADLTSAYVYWHTTPTTKMSIEGNLQRGGEVSNSEDAHFKLEIRLPANSTVNHWWYMILKVNSAKSLAGNLPQNSLFEFVATNKYSTAKHTVEYTVESVSPVGGAGTLKTFSSTLVALIAALGASMLHVVRP